MTAMSATHSKEEDRDKIEARLEKARIDLFGTLTALRAGALDKGSRRCRGSNRGRADCTPRWASVRPLTFPWNETLPSTVDR